MVQPRCILARKNILIFFEKNWLVGSRQVGTVPISAAEIAPQWHRSRILLGAGEGAQKKRPHVCGLVLCGITVRFVGLQEFQQRITRLYPVEFDGDTFHEVAHDTALHVAEFDDGSHGRAIFNLDGGTGQ